MEMKREPVQEEGQRTKERDQSEVESTSNLHADISIERILEAEKRVDCKLKEMNFTALAVNIRANCLTHICHTTVEQLLQIFSWARHIPHFISLPLEDQVCLLKNGWNELLIAAFSHRSMDVKDKDSIVLTVSMTVHRTSAQQAGAVGIFDRILSELVAKMREMKMDRTELECLRSIILFNPEVQGLKSVEKVNLLREKIYAALEEYTRVSWPGDSGRFAKLLLRLPSIRSISLKCLDYVFFFKLIGEDHNIHDIILQMFPDRKMYAF
ncbi:retinoic acid receptor RXR-like isoform X3 [Linepithema humile]|uniref:retinoic acid receptor RXR-like isoform X3 n=1 Tax=Linepithema humile TaxID=83485 RepID=UPI0006238854|nr:PREDICTED: retinoic acid receptor RXR-like isoform X2 [Linepithema humile]XP_012231277.1 PREDICTED: retinoic acid receptor RXR-like isoform X2 [Linepithema humile]